MLIIYHLLLDEFGPQNWWPGDSREEIIIGAILTQNTNWKNAEKSISNLKFCDLIDFSLLKKIDVEKLANLIRSSGYYNQKSKRLKIVADFFANHSISILGRISTSQFRKKLISIHGIGQETADSILLYAFERSIFVIDSYTKRIFQRFGYFDEKISYYGAQTFFMENLNSNCKLFNEYHALLVKLGKKFCKKNPECTQCPLESECAKKIIK